ncbi:MAG: PAS domain-containing protein [Alphaproteobacteria bacterium]
MREFHGSAEKLRPLLDSKALTEALDYWESLCPPGGFPARADFDPMVIHRLLGSVILLNVLPDDSFVYRLAGQVFEDRYQIGSLTGKTPEDALGDEADTVLRPYRLVRDESCLFFRDAAKDWLNREPSFNSYKALLLPFCEDGTTVNMILGVFDFTRR